jgi:hypothetical protein
MSGRRIVGIVLVGLSLGLAVRGDDALTIGLALFVGVVLLLASRW